MDKSKALLSVFAVLGVLIVGGVGGYFGERNSGIVISGLNKQLSDERTETQALRELLSACERQLAGYPDTLVIVRSAHHMPDWSYYRTGRIRSIEFTGVSGINYEIRFRDDETKTPPPFADIFHFYKAAQI